MSSNEVDKVESKFIELVSNPKLMSARPTFNSTLIVTLAGIGSITLMACLGVITGGLALPIIGGLVTAYAAHRELTKPKV